jgi:hypothetical protein
MRLVRVLLVPSLPGLFRVPPCLLVFDLGSRPMIPTSDLLDLLALRSIPSSRPHHPNHSIISRTRRRRLMRQKMLLRESRRREKLRRRMIPPASGPVLIKATRLVAKVDSLRERQGDRTCDDGLMLNRMGWVRFGGEGGSGAGMGLLLRVGLARMR